MTRPDLMARVYPAFATIDARGPARTDSMYRKWVHRLAFSEYADELVLHVVAQELRVHISCIPYTPADQLSPWKPSEYGPAVGSTIWLGNNDVHYVYLRPRP